jgi:L-malate glycosyltransferase
MTGRESGPPVGAGSGLENFWTSEEDTDVSTILDQSRQAMRVLHILDSLNRGGAEMMMLDVCRNAPANGLDLTFLATGGGDLEEEFQRSGVDFVRLQRRYPVDFGLIARLRRIVLERNISIIHSHQAVEALHAYFATRGIGRARRVLTLHGWIPTTKNRVASKFVIPRMNANLTVSRDLLDWLGREEKIETSKNFQVLYNGVDAGRLCHASGDVRAELGLDERHILLGMVSNFYLNVKDQLTVCKALPRLFSEAPPVHFIFAGGRSESAPQLYDDCVAFCREHGIADRVHFLGKRSDVQGVLKALDVFVFSSLQEGSPIAVIEAMMRGLPTVLSDIKPLLEVAGDGAYALPFRTRDPEDLARRLIELVQDSARRAELGARAKEWATAKFSIETHIANLLELYRALLAGVE